MFRQQVQSSLGISSREGIDTYRANRKPDRASERSILFPPLHLVYPLIETCLTSPEAAGYSQYVFSAVRQLSWRVRFDSGTLRAKSRPRYSGEGLFVRQRIKSSTESAANLCRLLILWHQDAVGTVEGHKLPLFFNHFPAHDLPRGAARIHEEKLAILFRYIGQTIHRDFPSRQAQGRWLYGALPFADAASRTRSTALARSSQRIDRLALLTKKLPLPAHLPAAFDYYWFSCH